MFLYSERRPSANWLSIGNAMPSAFVPLRFPSWSGSAGTLIPCRGCLSAVGALGDLPTMEVLYALVRRKSNLGWRGVADPYVLRNVLRTCLSCKITSVANSGTTQPAQVIVIARSFPANCDEGNTSLNRRMMTKANVTT